jgi:polysaccharide pyruvyl transferase WcaK-like protein
MASAHAIVGGTPIMDVLGGWPLCELTPLVQAMDRWKTPMTFIGVGVESLRLAQSRQIVADEIAPRVKHWTVRSDRDRERLITFGVPEEVVTTTADLAWLIEPAPAGFGLEQLKEWGIEFRGPLIGVNLVNENSVFDERPDLADQLAAALDGFIENLGAEVIFLSNEVREDSTFDKAAAGRVMAQMKYANHAVLAPNKYFSPQEMMSVIGCCCLTLSMRYHFCLFSALQQVPFIAIERTDKISDLCWDLEWPARVKPLEFSAADIFEYGVSLAENKADTDLQLGQIRGIMRDRSLNNVLAVDALESCLPKAKGELPIAAIA